MKLKYMLAGLMLIAAGFTAAWFLKPSHIEAPAEISDVRENNEIWTCSMHPQVRQDGPGQCPLCGMDLIPLSESDGEGSVMEMTAEAVQLANIQTSVIGTGAGEDREGQGHPGDPAVGRGTGAGVADTGGF